jgi:hypothetical protein
MYSTSRPVCYVVEPVLQIRIRIDFGRLDRDRIQEGKMTHKEKEKSEQISYF